MIEKNLNVLMLEDQQTDALLIKRQVKKALPECIITVARNRSEFFEKIEWLVPDIILSDYNLPDINGLEALLYIREKKPQLPFIFISGALNDEEKVAEAVLQGANGYVLKGNLDAIPEKIVEVLKNAEAQQSAAAQQARQHREAIVSIQKSLALLEKAPDFEEKETLQKLLSTTLEHL